MNINPDRYNEWNTLKENFPASKQSMQGGVCKKAILAWFQGAFSQAIPA